jgi:hypothetical protein
MNGNEIRYTTKWKPEVNARDTSIGKLNMKHSVYGYLGL